MAAIKTINFLPEVFRTDTNQKFLNATLDQLVTPPDLRKVNAYVGRKFAPMYKDGDNYQPEPDAQRQNYQLEPSVVVKDPTTNDVEFFSSYIDLLNQAGYSGSLTDNQSRMFTGETYSYNGLFDFDKFVNFNQYYWLPEGPGAVPVYGAGVNQSYTYTVTRDPSTGSYHFTGLGVAQNPNLRLAYGGTYKFIVNQSGYPFWIQSDPGVSGRKLSYSNQSSREVAGVTNNGTDVGVVTFTVPGKNSQQYYESMPITTVDFGVTTHYSQLQGQLLSSMVSNNLSFDGVVTNLEGKTLIFTNSDIDPMFWTVNGVTADSATWRSVWRIQLQATQNDYIVNLVPITTITTNQRIYIISGQTNSQSTFYINPSYNYYVAVPSLTASATTLYYQDGADSRYNGFVTLVDINDNTLKVDQDIIGKTGYTSPNGIEFTNGLTVQFDNSAVPSTYAGNAYYVEGVGTSIQLLPVTNFQTPESYAVGGLSTQDYITINRASQDLNPWTRSNRWFHIDVITATSTALGTVAVYNQTQRANRPIIEFEADLQLYNFGRKAKTPVDIFDFSITDARNQIELQSYFVLDGVILQDGLRVIFANDFDPTVRNKIFIIRFNSINQRPAITLELADDSDVIANNNLIVLQGSNKGKEYWFDGNQWAEGQQKTAINQTPMFDVVDMNGVSIGDAGVYLNSTFATTKNNLGTVVGGTAVFSYKVGTGSPDQTLGFPLSYRTFTQIGDVQFVNNFDTDTFNYTNNSGTVATANINTVGTLQQNINITNYNIRNAWTTVVEKSKQYQVISSTYNGTTPYVLIDVLPATSTTIPYIKAYKNFAELDYSLYKIVAIGQNNYVQVNDPDLVTGDQIDVLIYSNNSSGIGFYQVPDNLNYNSENVNFTTLTLGQLRNHVVSLVSNSTKVIGPAIGANNLRDQPVKAQGGNIVQNASPVLYSELFLVDPDTNFLKGLEYARHNYSRFKNKILEYAANLKSIDTNDIPGILDVIIQNINQVKNNTFPWYYSDMVPYGALKTTLTYTVINPEQTDYEISSVFDNTVLSNRAVLVYRNNQQLRVGTDYVFDTNRAGITFKTSLNYDDVITINEYSNTDANFVPETPTKLGLYPKFTPKIYLDTSYVNHINVIQGHDGSITPSFGDFRDQLLLEFELRIYNNIKVNYATNVDSIYNFLPGKFRTTDYSNAEFTQLVTRSFLQWVGSNRVDFTANNYFISDDPFTWNFGNFFDTVNGEQLQGTWRAIYKYFYDTDRPDIAPWEMLGFSEEPNWWQKRYGPQPYTGGNLVLWADIAEGYIWNGSEALAYTDSRFVRPNLLGNSSLGLPNLIPVDANGVLRPPSAFLVKSFNSNQANASYAVGQQGPVETAWRRSSDFPYALQEAIALANPAYFFGTLIDVSRYYKNKQLDQYVLDDTLQRITPIAININGQPIGDGTYRRAAGYLNWIADCLTGIGIDPTTKLISYLKPVQVQLAYKMAGYTDSSFLEVQAEQASPSSTTNSIVIPTENYKIQLYKSTPTKAIAYSAVIVELSENGYTVSGYDTNNPYFTIIPSIANNNVYTITVLNDVGIVYQDYQSYKVNIPYGYEFNNKQQLVDFLISYERFLVGSGFVFADFDQDLGTQRDFKLSVQEFLSWTQQGWQAGSVLVLSPTLGHLTVQSTYGVVDQILNVPMSSRVLDTAFNFLKYNNLTVTRTDNIFTLTTTGNQTIALAVLNLVEYEHVLIFDNVTEYNDVIYVPELGNRQYRLKLVGQKTGSWTGALNPPGFVYNGPNVDEWQPNKDYALGSLVKYKNVYYTATKDLTAVTTFNPTQWQQLSINQIQTGLLPNFSYNAAKFQKFNDLDNPELQGDFSRFVGTEIGFRPRQYLTDFGLDIQTQAKFYQGFIKQKGTINSITAFTAAGFNGISSNINLYEEWAMRVGEYGALHNNQYIELELVEGQYNGDPVTFTLLANNEVNPDNTVSVYPANLYLTGDQYTAGSGIYTNRDDTSYYGSDILTAGYVHKDQIDIQIFDMANYGELNQYLDTITIGTKIWAAKDNITTSWNVYRVTETNVSVLSMAYAIDVTGVVTTATPHNLTTGTFVVINDFDNRTNGVYQVTSAVDNLNFTVTLTSNSLIPLKSAGQVLGVGVLYTLNSMRLKDSTDITTIAPPGGWLDGDKLWSDYDQITGGWVVYNKSSPWTTANTNVLTNVGMELDANSYISNSGFGSVTTIAPNASFVAASIPNLNNGNVIVFVSNVANGNTFTMVGNIGPQLGGTRFGSSLASTNNLLYIGNLGTNSGNVHIYSFDGNASFTSKQTLTSPFVNNNDQFGYSISASTDGTWLYVGAPGVGNVYVYHANTSSYYTLANTISGNNYVSSGNAISAQFGHGVTTTSDGTMTTIGAPYETVGNVVSAGAVYVFNRSRESFVATGNTTYHPQYPITSSTALVTVNGIVQTSNFTLTGSSVSFNNAPVIGTIVTIDTNKIQLLEKLTAPTPTSGAAFGVVSTIAGNDADVYVASPGYSEPGYYSGIVYRFVNEGANYGTITSTITEPTVAVGSNFYINGIQVTFGANTPGSTIGNLQSIAANINSANIAGITAVAQPYGLLTLTSNVTVPYEKLIITPGSGNAIVGIGLSTFADVQSFLHPGTADVSQFGSQIVSNYDSSSIAISASKGATYNPTDFDDGVTDFDNSATDFADGTSGSGVVYIYGLVEGSLSTSTPDQYVMVQQLHNNSLSANDGFGTSLALGGNVLLVGAPGDSNHVTTDPESGLIVTIPNSGTYYTYNNFSGNVGWDIICGETPKVDIDSITRMYIYNNTTSTLITNFDWIDPAKGKVLGAAQEDLDYITAYDPAIYNSGGVIEGVSNASFNIDYHWGPAQVTKTWWDIGQVRYYDYEQGNLTYRSSNWGATFPGSNIQVAEWVQSDVPPAQYNGNGQALYPDNSAFVLESYVDPATKIIRSHYYYWVVNKTTLETDSKHVNSISTIQDVIAHPTAQSIPYATVLRDDTVSLYNVADYLIGAGNTTVFHADYDTIKNTNIIHSEFQLIQEGNSGSLIPERIVNKMIDSLAGADSLGNPVPAPSLLMQASLGLGTNPNQTLFLNRLTALENFVQYINDILIQYPIVEEFIITSLYDSDPLPDPDNYDITVNSYLELTYVDTAIIVSGYTVLVTRDETQNNFWALYHWTGSQWQAIQVQSYYTPSYWSFANWYASDYNPTVKVTFQVPTYSDLVSLSPFINDTAKVVNRGNGQFSIYRWDGAIWNLVGIEAGTLQLNETLYTETVASNEIRIIFDAIKNNIFIDTLKIHFNKLFFFLINYILTEQQSVDWVFKTSFITIFHQLRKLSQYPAYIQDNQTYYENYINEVKPYRTSIREYLVDYTGDDKYEGDMTDFDVPATYISNVSRYRSPNGTITSDTYALANLPQYSEWYANHGYGIGTVTVSNSGSGYTTTPTITVVGGGGSGANVQATVDFATGKITKFDVVAPGSGYMSTPVLHINGTGTGAIGYPMLVNQHYVKSIPTLDIVLSTPALVKTGDIITQPTTGAAGTVYDSSNGHIITLKNIDLVNVNGTFQEGGYLYNNGVPLQVRPGVSNTVLTVNGNASVKNGDIVFQPTSGASGEVYLTTANTQIYLWNTVGTFLGGQWLSVAGGNLAVFPTYYTISSNSTPFSTYTSYENHSYNLVRSFDTTIKFDRITYTSNIVPWSHNDSYTFTSDFDDSLNPYDVDPYDSVLSSQWVRYQGKGYSANGIIYSKSSLRLSGNITANVGDFVTQFNNNANATVISISSNNLITVGNVTGDFVKRAGNIIINGTVTTVNPVAVNDIFDYTQFNLITDDSFTTAADRIKAMYQPSSDQPGVDLAQLMSGVEYPGKLIQGVPYNATTSNITANVFYYYANTSTLYSSNIAAINFVDYSLKPNLAISIFNNDTHTASNVTIMQVTPGSISIAGGSSLVGNITLGTNLSIVYYDTNSALFLDSVVQGPTYFNNDTSQGLNPSDITIDGGAYYDTYSSFAPEELVPGRMFDNLNMTVYTRVNTAPYISSNVSQVGTNTVAYRIVYNMNTNASSTNYSLWPQYYSVFAANTSTLSANLHLTDNYIQVTNARAFMTPNPYGYPLHPGVVFINGEKITYWTVDIANNRLGQLRRGVDGTGAANLHVTGSQVQESSVNQLLPTTTTANANVHLSTWLNPTTLMSNVYLLSDTVGNYLTTDGAIDLVQFAAGTQQFITLTANVNFNAGDTITQPIVGISAAVSANILQTQQLLSANISGNLSYLGNILTVSADSELGGQFVTTGEGANSWISINGSNVNAQVSTVSYSITTGDGLINSTSPQAQFILQGLAPSNPA